MCNKSPFKVPEQYHYDVFEVDTFDKDRTTFMCSSSRETAALIIAESLTVGALRGVEYRVRTRPQKAHTIYKIRA